MTPECSVLVVDDDEDIRDSLIGCLEGEGYHPIGAPDGKRALQMLEELDHPPCVIVLDLMMPVMDGRKFREEQLRSPAFAKIPVVLISAYGLDPTALARELQIADFLSKPVDPATFLQLIEARCRDSCGRK
jgi:CheY-like chemotaxis protein